MPKTTTPTRSHPGAAANPEVIRARGFELVDRGGNPRALFGFDSEDSDELCQVVLLDPNSRPRIAMTCDAGGPALGILGNNALRAMIALVLDEAGDDGSIGLSLSDAEGEDQFMVAVDETGSVKLGGWASWANEGVAQAEVTAAALKILAARVGGFMNTEHSDHAAGDEDMAKICAGMRREGQKQRSDLINAMAGLVGGQVSEEIRALRSELADLRREFASTRSRSTETGSA